MSGSIPILMLLLTSVTVNAQSDLLTAIFQTNPQALIEIGEALIKLYSAQSPNEALSEAPNCFVKYLHHKYPKVADSIVDCGQSLFGIASNISDIITETIDAFQNIPNDDGVALFNTIQKFQPTIQELVSVLPCLRNSASSISPSREILPSVAYLLTCMTN